MQTRVSRWVETNTRQIAPTSTGMQATFDALMGKLDEMGVFDQGIEEKIKEEMEVALSLVSKSKDIELESMCQ